MDCCAWGKKNTPDINFDQKRIKQFFLTANLEESIMVSSKTGLLEE